MRCLNGSHSDSRNISVTWQILGTKSKYTKRARPRFEFSGALR